MSKVNIGALLILAVMFFLMLYSAWGDSAIMDELAHIPAGFGYIKEHDYRLNPEHPPLIKALSTLSSQLFVNPRFPTDTKAWRDDLNGQWDQGRIFLYESGNNADAIIFWARLPLMLLSILFGWLFFQWVKKRFGKSTAFLALLFFAFSPTILAHSRYVTTDLGASFGFFIGIWAFLNFLEAPTWKNLFLAGFAFGIAELLKFSLVLLIPIYGILFLVWVLTRPRLHLHERLRAAWEILGGTICIGLIGILLVWIVYIPFVWNYPQERQIHDAKIILSSYKFKPAADIVLSLIKNPVARPLGEYFLGVLMVNQRAAGGNTQYFLGEVSNLGSHLYFPTLYIFKETLAFHTLTLIALLFGISKILRAQKEALVSFGERLRFWIENHFTEFAALVFIAFYWGISIQSPLNIGIRHVMPTFPFIYFLVARQISEWLGWHELADPKTWFQWLRNIYQIYIRGVWRYFIVLGLLLWLIFSTLGSYPHFLSYYNELAGGSGKGYLVAVDSNYDWGQDLKRLKAYAERNNIQKIALDYFGGGNPHYYLGEKFEPWWSARGPRSGWFAISATFRQGAFGKTTPGFIRKEEDSYQWLKAYVPVARIGSIFVYKLP